MNMPISNQIRQDAFKHIARNEVAELLELIAKNPGLIEERSHAGSQDTLFMRACEYLKKDIIEMLINEGANLTDTNNHGNNGIMYLFYRHDPKIPDLNKHDEKALEILKLFVEKNISLEGFTAQDRDKDTPLIEVARAALPKSTNFIIELLQSNNLLHSQLLHKNNNEENALQAALKAKFFNEELIKKTLLFYGTEKTTEIFIDAAIKINSPTEEEKKALLTPIKEYLPKLEPVQIKKLANNIFKEKFCEVGTGIYTSTSHKELLQCEKPKAIWGEKIFNSIDLELIELLYVAGGINLADYKSFVNSLPSLNDSELTTIKQTYAVILESNKQKMLHIINGSKTLSNLLKNPTYLNWEESDGVAIKDLALKRFCFLAANKENLEITEKSEVGILLTFVNFGNNFKEYKYDIYNNFRKYLIEESKNSEKFIEVLKNYGDKISEIVKFEPHLIFNSIDCINSFKYNVDILTGQVEKLLNPNLENIFPRGVFLNLVNDKKEEKIDPNIQKFIQENLKCFQVQDNFQMPEYDKLYQDQFGNSIEYYKNNPKSLIPNLALLDIANNEQKICKIKEILSSPYLKAKSTVGACLNVIISGQKYLKDLEAADLDTSLDKQSLQDKLPILSHKIKEALDISEIEKLKNINSLCNEVNKFLNISPLVSLFEEYNNNYQMLELKINDIQEMLGDIGIEWSFD